MSSTYSVMLQRQDMLLLIRAKLFPSAKLVLINHASPESDCLQAEEYGIQEFEEKMLHMASKADLIFSIGPKIHQYFQNAYRAEVNDKYLSEIPHEEILPIPVSCQLGKDPQKGEIQQHSILTCGQIDTQEAIERCDIMAASIGTAANQWKATHTNSPMWKIQGVSHQADKTVEKFISDTMKCPYIKPTLHPGHSAQSLLRSLQQSHLCLPAPWYYDYSFYGLEAMVSGLPTAVDENSHLAHFITKYFEDHADYSIVRSPEEHLSDTIVNHLQKTHVAFKKAKQLKTDLVNSKVISTSHAKFATLLTTPVKRQSGDDSEDQGVERYEKESLDVQIKLDNNFYDQCLKEIEEEMKALPAQLRKEKMEEMVTKLNAALKDCKRALKRKVEEVVADEVGCVDVKKVCKDKLGDGVDPLSATAESLAILLRLLTLYNLYRVKQACRCGSLAKAFEPLLITDEMREIAAEVGIKLQLKATYKQERFKEVELFFINRDGGGIQPMKFHDVLAKDSAEDVMMSSNKAAETDYVEDNVADISEDDLKHETDPSKLLILEIDPALEIKSSTETSVQTMFKAEKCIRLKRRQCDMLQVLTTNTDTVQHILSCRQDVLALLGVTRYMYLLTDAPNQDMDTQEMELQLTRGGTKVLTPPVSDENVSLLARSLLPCQISQVQITEYMVEQLLAQISEKDSEIDLQKSVLQHQLDEAKQEKANLVEHIEKLTHTIDITEKELTKRVDKSMYEKLSSELEEKERIISDLEAKLSALEEIQSELKIQEKGDIKVGSQYYEDEEGTEDVIGTTLDDAKSKTKITDNKKDKTLLQSTSVRGGSEMETATPTQPEMTGREGSEMETATATQPQVLGEGIRKDTTMLPEAHVAEKSVHEERLVTMGKEHQKQKKDSGGIFRKISKRIFGRKEKSDGSTVMPESKQEQSSVSTGGEEVPSGSVASKMSGGTATTGSKQEQRSSVTTGGEEMPSGPVSSKMSSGTATTGSKQEQRRSVTGGEQMPSGPVSSKMSGGTATTGSKQEQRRSVTGGEQMPSGPVSSKMSGGTVTTGSKSEHWSRRTLKGHQGNKFKGVRGLAFHNDKLLVCDSGNNIVHILNQDYTCEKELGSFSGQFAKPFKPRSIAVSQDNLYFILDDSNVQIVVCDQNNKVIRIITLPTNSNPWCIALVKGFVIVTDVNGHRVLKYSQTGQYIAECRGGHQDDRQTPFNHPRFVAVNSRDVIMVSDYLNHCIKCFDAQFNFLYQYGHRGHGDSQLSYPYSITVDGADHVYVCNGNNRISIWIKDGTCIGHLFHHQVIYPCYMAVTADSGRIAVESGSSWSDNEIVVFSK